MIKNKALYWALIGTFIILYIAIAFVSTLHAITFFQLANSIGLSILLGASYEIGQSAVLFAILLTDNKNKLLAWSMMILLTSLQISANVYASFKFIDSSGSNDWTYWQRSILFSVQAESAESYKVIISWISGALLPLVALGMTSLVADNIKYIRGDNKEEKDVEKIEEKPIDLEKKYEPNISDYNLEIIKENVKDIGENDEIDLNDESLKGFKDEYDRLSNAQKIQEENNSNELFNFPITTDVIKDQIEIPLQSNIIYEDDKAKLPTKPEQKEEIPKKPKTKKDPVKAKSQKKPKKA